MTRPKMYIGLIGWILVSFLAGLVGAIVEPGVWYEMLNKPAWTPPNWVFPVVWPILYLCMGVAAWLVWKKAGFDQARDALTLFLVQLALNGLWSWVFFGWHQIGTALANIMLLWIIILFTTLAFRIQSKGAFWLMVPYLVWVGYATALNFSIWNLN
ncbi:tryptophan-rich sensory protein [Aliifodinibius sp. S!AR15-10]|uniref:TspO/MBR family protein n=1 Tax=Aliifodinibius sp. S!AR15-10 TaxID=2950437 RepID=UPI00286781EC|nr:TspO/MBR family protein [Aliifodinibius sp. S!AR15-10]MDR8394020.1 tryptophan-rich sensory protein [Aliifodinibius sp. S!AR15-10]